MSGVTVDIEAPEGVADAYLARPGAVAPQGGVLLLMDGFGLRPQIERMADRVAERGFVVLAPNVFYRAGRAPVISLEGLDDPARRPEVIGRIMPLIEELTAERVTADAHAYLDRLAEEAGGAPIAITGYCMGGRLGWEIAAAYPDRVAALGCFHTGRLVREGGDSPHLSAGKIDAELYLGFADQDASMTAEQIAIVERALDEAGVSYRSEIYDGALHGYTMADTPAYDEEAAERHFRELFALIGRTIAA